MEKKKIIILGIILSIIGYWLALQNYIDYRGLLYIVLGAFALSTICIWCWDHLDEFKQPKNIFNRDGEYNLKRIVGAILLIGILVFCIGSLANLSQNNMEAINGIETTPSEPKTKLAIEPRDHVNIEVDQTEFTIKGTTDSGATVVISSDLLNLKDVKIPVDKNGKFKYKVNLPLDEKEISIKIVASSKNKKYSSVVQYLTRKSQNTESSSSVQENERIAYETYQEFMLTYKNIHDLSFIRNAWKTYDINGNDKLEASEYDKMLRDDAI